MPVQHLPGQPWAEAVLAPVEAETTAPPAPASIAASTKSRSEPLEPPALTLPTGTGLGAGASLMSFWGQEQDSRLLSQLDAKHQLLCPEPHLGTWAHPGRP